MSSARLWLGCCDAANAATAVVVERRGTVAAGDRPTGVATAGVVVAGATVPGGPSERASVRILEASRVAVAPVLRSAGLTPV